MGENTGVKSSENGRRNSPQSLSTCNSNHESTHSPGIELRKNEDSPEWITEKELGRRLQQYSQLNTWGNNFFYTTNKGDDNQKAEGKAKNNNGLDSVIGKSFASLVSVAKGALQTVSGYVGSSFIGDWWNATGGVSTFWSMGEETGEELEEDSITFDNDGSPSKNAASQQDSEDDCKHEKIKGYYKGGYHPVLLGTLLNRRYHVIKKLGHGHFSTVWLTWDTKNKRLVACKIVKSQRSYTEAAIDEIAILERIREADQIDPDRQRCTQLLDQFIVKGINGIHVVMVMDVLGPNLLKFIRKYSYDEMGIEIVKPIVKQILQGLNYMHVKCNLIHTDIKPENLCFELSEGVIKRMALSAIDIQIAKQPIPKSHKSTLAGKFGDALENLPKDLKLAMKINAHNSKLNFEEQIPDDRYSLKMNELIENYKINEESLGAIVKPSLKNIKEDIERHYENVDEETDTHDEIDWSTAKVKIADMGNAVRSTDKHDHTIQTKPYRSPEVILGIPYNETADIWSLACTVYEMITSAYLFKSRKLDKTWEEAHLTAIFDVLGPIPPYIALTGKNSKKYFDPKGIFKFAEELTIPKAIVETLIEKYDIPPEVANQLSDFLLPMLDYDVNVRAKASQCLKHIWLKESQ